ncbi:hypothetical protein GCM10011614_28960 [Novosphingobium colocasiae]|uniref:DUF2846 domain-containing protein n=2 Tax=Novosphingobium colocasiae TaxID=1256513 RepID=A0A918PJ36_9SPHN|nr:hypothetical protein GCM10011614_28960 [Novosphingobium colocasiae]
MARASEGDASNPEIAAASAIPADANLIVYRKYAEPTAWMPTVKIDGVKIAAVPNRHFVATKVALGAHKVALSWPLLSGQRNAEMDFTVVAEERQFFEVTGTSRVSGGGAGYLTFNMGSGIAQVKADYAEKTIQECCRLKPVKEASPK